MFICRRFGITSHFSRSPHHPNINSFRQIIYSYSTFHLRPPKWIVCSIERIVLSRHDSLIEGDSRQQKQPENVLYANEIFDRLKYASLSPRTIVDRIGTENHVFESNLIFLPFAVYSLPCHANLCRVKFIRRKRANVCVCVYRTIYSFCAAVGVQ